MDYSKGKIYKIIDESNGDLYIGSTIQELETRFKTHHLFYRCKKYNKIKSNCKISLIEEYPCDNRRELEKREQYWIDKNDCINLSSSFMDIDKRTIDTRDRAKSHYHNNKTERKNLIQEWRDNNRNHVLNYQRQRNNYRNSWGGDERRENNLLLIDVNLFT